MGTVRDLIAYRQRREPLVRREAEAFLPTAHGEFRLFGYVDPLNGGEHLALVMGEVADGRPVLVRVHSECLTGDALHSLRCDCGAQRDAALAAIAAEGRGALLYLRQEGRGIGLINKIRAYALQDQGADTVEANERLGFAADLRDYGVGAQILLDLGVRRLRLLTNNPRKGAALARFGLEVVEEVPLWAGHNPYNRRYLRTKQLRLGHRLWQEEVR